MNSLIGIATCLIFTVSGAVSLTCYSGVQTTCVSGADCDTYNSVAPTLTVTQESCASGYICYSVFQEYTYSATYVVTSFRGSTWRLYVGGCIPNYFTRGCYDLVDDLGSYADYFQDNLQDLAGLSDVSYLYCYCDEELCNGVSSYGGVDIEGGNGGTGTRGSGNSGPGNGGSGNGSLGNGVNVGVVSFTMVTAAIVAYVLKMVA